METNPLTLLPDSVRRWVYAALWIASVVIAGFQVADGDWLKTAVFVLGALGFGMAQANVPKS